MSLLNKASLIQIPSGYKDGTLYSAKPTNGDGDFTFSRGSNLAATRVNSEGLIEKGRENLLLQSNSFDTTWLLSGVTRTSGQSGYDGSNDAWQIDKTTSDGYIYQNLSASGVLNYSVYLKAGTVDWVRLQVNASTAYYQYINLTNGVLGLGGNISSKTTSVGNGWYRCEFAFTDSSVSRVRIYPAINDGDVSGTSGSIYIQDAQLELGLVATDYIETGASTAQAGILEDMPRLDYSGGATCGSLLLEPQRTNGNTHSEYFEAWNLVNSGISVLTPNEYISPEGLQNAYKLEFTGSGGSSQIYQVLSGVGIGTVCTASVFVKYISGSGDNFRITKSFATAGVVCDFTNNGENLSVSEVGSSTSDDVGFEDMGNGWFRIYFTFTSDTTNWEININRASGSGSDVYAIYGYQLETSASYASSYIPTYGSSSTRSEDIVDGAVDANLFNDDEGVLFVEFAALADTRDNEFRFLISDGTNNERIQIGLQTSNTLYCSVISSNSATADFTTSLGSPSSTHKVAIRYKSNDFAAYLDGTQIGTDTSGGTPSGLDRFDFYRTPNNNNYVEANVKQTIYFNSALTNDELADLTTL